MCPIYDETGKTIAESQSVGERSYKPLTLLLSTQLVDLASSQATPRFYLVAMEKN